jgi:hypothetical protein
LDERLNEAGYLRLMINKPLIQNMSNRVPIEKPTPKAIAKKRKYRLRDSAVIKKVLLRIHDWIFSLYYEQ